VSSAGGREAQTFDTGTITWPRWPIYGFSYTMFNQDPLKGV
jgi:hypothetical protein